jgi:hypothetical protein
MKLIVAVQRFRKIKRSSWRTLKTFTKYISIDDAGFLYLNDFEEPYPVTVEEILADDWEEYKE